MPKNEAKYKRILLKIGGESLLGNKPFGISTTATNKIAKQIKEVYEMDVQIALVIGGGNIFRGISGEKIGIERATADYMGMLGTVMNGLAMQDALEKIGIDTRVHSSIEMKAVCETYVRRKAVNQMKRGKIVILAAGIGDPYVTTDTGAALRSLELNCDILIKGTKVAGVYDKDPMIHKDSKRYDKIIHGEALKNDSINVMDNAALSLCMDHDMPILIFNFFENGALKKAIQGKKVGTLVTS